MQTSPLRLEGYYFEEVAVTIVPDLRQGMNLELWTGFHPFLVDADRGINFTFGSTVEFSRKEDESRRFRVRITVKSDNENSPGLAYEFNVALVGYFRVDEQYPDERVDLLVSVNGPSVLYSAAREALATLTGRGPYPAVVLPTVVFPPATLTPDKRKSKRERKALPAKRVSRKK